MIGGLEAILWLTLNVYHEARSEDQFNQIAVAHLTLNRANKDGRTIKQTVLKDRQFSWTFQKTKDEYWPDDLNAFLKCLKSVRVAATGYDFTQGATHYHERKVKPYWTKGMHQIGTFGAHKFYVSRR